MFMPKYDITHDHIKCLSKDVWSWYCIDIVISTFTKFCFYVWHRSSSFRWALKCSQKHYLDRTLKSCYQTGGRNAGNVTVSLRRPLLPWCNALPWWVQVCFRPPTGAIYCNRATDETTTCARGEEATLSEHTLQTDKFLWLVSQVSSGIVCTSMHRLSVCASPHWCHWRLHYIDRSITWPVVGVTVVRIVIVWHVSRLSYQLYMRVYITYTCVFTLLRWHNNSD